MTIRRAAAHPAEAEAILREAVAARATDDALHAHLGLTLLDAAKPEEAVAALGKARELAPQNPAWPVWFALAAIDLGDSFNAREALIEAERLGPGNELAKQIGWLLDLREGEPVKALEGFSKHRPLDNWRLLGRLMLEVERILMVAHGPPADGEMPTPAAHNVLKEIGARKTFKKGVKILETLIESCCFANERKRAETALPLLEQALTDDATVPRGWYYLGAAYVTAGRYANAETCFEKSLVDDKETPDNQYGLARVMHETGRLDDALKLYAHTIDLFEKNPEAYLGWGQLLLQMGREVEARPKLAQAAHYWMDFAYDRIEEALRLVRDGDKPCEKCKATPLPRYTPPWPPEPVASAPETTL